MKKILLSISALVLLTACSSQVSHPSTQADTLAFKTEYEALNAEKLAITIPETMKIHTLDFSGVKSLLEEGDGILYFGFPSCPWCRTLLPQLFTTMEKHQLSELFVFNPKEIRDQKSLDENGNLLVTIPTSEEYQYLLDRLDSLLPAYEGLNDPALKRLYVPLVVVIKEGKILTHHFNTLEDQEDPNLPLTSEQESRLQELLEKMLTPLLPQTCSAVSPAC